MSEQPSKVSWLPSSMTMSKVALQFSTLMSTLPSQSLSSSSHRRPRTFADVEGSTGGVGDSNAGGDGSDDDGSGEFAELHARASVSPVLTNE